VDWVRWMSRSKVGPLDITDGFLHMTGRFLVGVHAFVSIAIFGRAVDEESWSVPTYLGSQVPNAALPRQVHTSRSELFEVSDLSVGGAEESCHVTTIECHRNRWMPTRLATILRCDFLLSLRHSDWTEKLTWGGTCICALSTYSNA
jgi:hypothetical protein